MSKLESFDTLLRQLLEDKALSRGEDRSLRELMQKLRPDPREQAVLEARVFAIADEALEESDAKHVLQWVRGVLAALRNQEPVTSGDPPEAWFSPEKDCVSRIIDFIEASKSSLEVCVFTITDNRLARAIERVHRRGVKVRILTDNDKSNDLGSDVDQLAQAGVATRKDTSPYHMHHKFALSDRRELLTGSYNWTRGAAENNEENFVISRDPVLVRMFTDEFERLWNAHA